MLPWFVFVFNRAPRLGIKTASVRFPTRSSLRLLNSPSPRINKNHIKTRLQIFTFSHVNNHYVITRYHNFNDSPKFYISISMQYSTYQPMKQFHFWREKIFKNVSHLQTTDGVTYTRESNAPQMLNALTERNVSQRTNSDYSKTTSPKKAASKIILQRQSYPRHSYPKKSFRLFVSLKQVRFRFYFCNSYQTNLNKKKIKEMVSASHLLIECDWILAAFLQ